MTGSSAGPVLCYYADKPARRRHCTLTAEVALGAVTLCRSCAAERSTLGKGIVAVPLPPGPAIDVLDWIAQAAAAARQAQRGLDAAITRARSQGRTWDQIAGRLGVTRQAAQQRYGHHPSSPRNEG
jgi:hypothetical protein